ncbi:MAG TPA: hypothetical protein VEC11_11300 [Allosphingosinicella sp.]|nr:hypothetical protein [Allosphingosinicella sp.]
MSGAVDLSGDWIGFYNYDFPCPPTQFEAAIRDCGGLITGVTTERFDGPDGLGTVLQAVIDGRREGAILRFTKIYDDLALAPDVIFYEGLIQSEGDEVEGDWSIPGQGAGTFMMMRKSGKKAAETLKVEEKVPAGR